MSKRDPRKVFGETLLELGRQDEKVLAMSCDSAAGSGMTPFVTTFPERYVECGISEQNGIDVAVGLASVGFKPVISAVAPFITYRCYEQIRNDVGYGKANVVIAGSSSGLQQATLGSSHQAVEDIAVLRAVPNLVIINPGDPYEVDMALRQSVAYNGPVYIRMPRAAVEDNPYPAGESFEIGKAYVLRKPGKITLIATGMMTAQALAAAEILAEKGIEAGVVNVPTLKPIDKETILAACKASEYVFTVEEHITEGGLGSIVAELMAGEGVTAKLNRFGIPEGAAENGPYFELIDAHGLSGRKIADRVVAAVK
jgi:transketolase